MLIGPDEIWSAYFSYGYYRRNNLSYLIKRQ